MTYATVRVPMTFPKENRPIFITPVANMTAKEKDTAYPRMVTAVLGMLDHHPVDRVLLHTVSYDLAGYLRRELGRISDRPFITYGSSADREKAVAEYRQTPNAVLIASSLDRGVDFKHDDCRVVGVCKIPYPNLGDKQVSARMHSRNGSFWYSVQTVRTLVQMTGRGVRSADDHCTSYILDQQFLNNIYKRSKSLLPNWWTESLDMSGQFVRPFLKGGASA